MTTTTDRIYGAQTAGVGRTVQDIGLCDLKGEYVYTAKLRTKGLLAVVFFSPDSAPAVRALEAVQGWTKDLPTQKWTALAITEGDRDQLRAFAQERGLDGVTVLVDHELYQTRSWGVSHLPSVYLISGKTGRVLMKVIGDRADDLGAVRQRLADEVAQIVAAEEAARKAAEEAKRAEDEKKAAEAAAKK
jgi:peroxiredoxin